MEQYEVVPALRDAIENRRKALGLGPGDLAEAAGVTNQGLMPLRKGYRKQYQDRLTSGVCRALGWTTDSIDRILAGEPPRLTTNEPASDDRLDQILTELAELRTRIEHLEQQGEVVSARPLRLAADTGNTKARVRNRGVRPAPDEDQE